MKGKVVVITGGGTGIGAAAAQEFARKGAKIVIADIDQVLGESSLSRVREIGEAIFVKTDVTKRIDVERLVNRILNEYQVINALVNNVGVMERLSDPIEVDEEMWTRMLDTNLRSAYLCSKTVIPQILKQRYGSIVNVSSMNNFMGSGSNVAYGCAKAGVITLTRFLARRLAPHIRVNCVALGIMDTRAISDMSADRKAELEKAILLKRFGRPEEAAKAILFLSSDEASYITGQTLIVDGGQFLQTP